MMFNLAKTLADVAPPIGAIAGFAILVIAAIVGIVLLVKRFLKNRKQ